MLSNDQLERSPSFPKITLNGISLDMTQEQVQGARGEPVVRRSGPVWCYSDVIVKWRGSDIKSLKAQLYELRLGARSLTSGTTLSEARSLLDPYGSFDSFPMPPWLSNPGDSPDEGLVVKWDLGTLEVFGVAQDGIVLQLGTQRFFGKPVLERDLRLKAIADETGLFSKD